MNTTPKSSILRSVGAVERRGRVREQQVRGAARESRRLADRGYRGDRGGGGDRGERVDRRRAERRVVLGEGEEGQVQPELRLRSRTIAHKTRE